MIAHSFILFYTMTDNTKEVQHDEKVNQWQCVNRKMRIS